MGRRSDSWGDSASLLISTAFRARTAHGHYTGREVPQDIGTDRTVARLVGGRYQITGLLASGGMGEVFQAHDRVLERTVALKVLRATLGADPDFVERFRKEATAAGRLSHPNIVQVYDWGRDEGGSAYMAMEFVEGQNLREVLAANPRLRPAVAARIAAQVCGALEHARRAGIVHRDVKPENILVGPDGQVKVADFGLARALAESRATQAGLVFGTAHYLAPEQVEGRGSDHRADLYALGVVLYEMLTGETPFAGDNPVVIAYQRVREDVPPPSARAPGVPDALDAVVRRATARSPDARFPSAREMGEALRSAVPRSDTGDVALLVHPTVAIPIATQETVNLGRRRRRLTRRGIVLIAALLALALGSVPVLVGALARVQVPKVTGLTKDAAVAALEKAGLEASTDFQNDSRVPVGRVIRQDPAPEASVRKGSTVTIIVSLGPVTVEVPKVVGLDYEDAKRTLERLGLEVAKVEAFSRTVVKGAVIEQDRDPGVLVNAGSTVTLTVSKGKEIVAVPDVKGKPEAEAKDTLTRAGFAVTVKREFSDTVAEGVVISQTPAAGTRAEKGSAVAVVVSQGPTEFPMPDVRGQDFDDAKAALEAKGLVVERQQVPGSVGDTVVGQKPSPGRKVKRGDKVTLFTA